MLFDDAEALELFSHAAKLCSLEPTSPPTSLHSLYLPHSPSSQHSMDDTFRRLVSRCLEYADTFDEATCPNQAPADTRRHFCLKCCALPST